MISYFSSRDRLNRARSLIYGSPDLNLEKASSETRPSIDEYIPYLQRKAEQAGLNPSNALLIVVNAAILSGIFVILGLFVNIKMTLLSPLPFLIYFFWIERLIAKRTESFECDYPAFLLSLASGIRTGLDPIVALCREERVFHTNSLLKKELIHCRENLEKGMPEDKALGHFAESIAHPDIELFRIGFILARKQGSSLSHCLQRLVKVTRQRQSFRRKIASAVAMQKLSSFGIVVCAFAIGMIQFLGNPSAFSQAIAHPFGIKAIAFGAFLMSTGIVWMLSLTKRKL
ncbi:MAG: hypothetical protein GYA55_05345 [SAR324 cluster bacterium]|uniref:Type II secretion system protein GspF domain-containing protein n=1 Tax=SAR324 cluster bacterium TaxID=2024889 RepID=A0A7X9IJX6_9DELT|nr:hypothetical protein [SAR324 cluster bacterium]